jgi:hypothetical protein
VFGTFKKFASISAYGAISHARMLLSGKPFVNFKHGSAKYSNQLDGFSLNQAGSLTTFVNSGINIFHYGRSCDCTASISYFLTRSAGKWPAA